MSAHSIHTNLKTNTWSRHKNLSFNVRMFMMQNNETITNNFNIYYTCNVTFALFVSMVLQKNNQTCLKENIIKHFKVTQYTQPFLVRCDDEKAKISGQKFWISTNLVHT